jgi:hypothetical protein
MRRLLIIALLLGVIACVLLVYLRQEKRSTESLPMATGPVEAAAQAHVPRLAIALQQDAGMDARAHARDEKTLVQQIRENVKSNPQRAESLAREGRRLFPDGADAEERDALLVDALINQQRIGAARSETYYYFDHYPTGRFADHLFIMTGVHPRPLGPSR